MITDVASNSAAGGKGNGSQLSRAGSTSYDSPGTHDKVDTQRPYPDLPLLRGTEQGKATERSKRKSCQPLNSRNGRAQTGEP